MDKLPEQYFLLSEQETVKKIKDIKRKYGSGLVILGHHYEQDLIVELSDLKGDSFALAKMASEQEKAEHIVFCGVYFMAEAARILAKPAQTVYLPNHTAGCPLADFADIESAEKAWTEMQEYIDTEKVIPACYMNSSADIKAFCGEHGGIVCTSSNAEKIFRWAFEQGEKLFFMPDEQLGRNTAAKLGVDEIMVWDKSKHLGGNTAEQIKNAKIIVWKGYCHVHALKFTIENVKQLREKYPGIKIVVHPECTPDVVNACDAAGSTSFIIDYVKDAPKDSVIGIGTELNMVNRLYNEYKGEKTIVPVNSSICPDMMKISVYHLLYCLENLVSGDFAVEVNDNVIINARKALERMLEVG